jgi:predicted DsbA family dithiol-disulfide isomerase
MRTVLILPALMLALSACAQPPMTDPTPTRKAPLTVEIWSDVACPFCYIGKREFERALERFPHRDSVQVVWKSFELAPDAPARLGQDTYTMLAQKYGMSREEAVQRVSGVAERGRSVGIPFNFDAVVNGNTFDAHRLIQLAKQHGKGDAAEERLFKAYFEEGAALADHATLKQLANDIGLDPKDVEALLAGTALSDAVRMDEYEAQQFGIRGVPFFAIDRKYGISGAQSAEHFLGALEQAWKERPVPEAANAPACEPGKADCLPGQ